MRINRILEEALYQHAYNILRTFGKDGSQKIIDIEFRNDNASMYSISIHPARLFGFDFLSHAL